MSAFSHTRPVPRGVRTAGRRRAAGTLIATALAALVVLLTTWTPIRAVAATVLILGPGVALVPLLGVADRALNLTLVILLSAVALVCIAQLVTYVGGFTWQPCAAMLVVLTVLGCVLQLARSAKHEVTR